jgi:hypothetical protein
MATPPHRTACGDATFFLAGIGPIGLVVPQGLSRSGQETYLAGFTPQGDCLKDGNIFVEKISKLSLLVRIYSGPAYSPLEPQPLYRRTLSSALLPFARLRAFASRIL